MAEVIPDIVLQTEIGDGQFSCQGFSGVPAATRSWICLVSSGSDESRASVAALSTELVAVLLGSSPAVVVSEVPGAEAPSAFDPSRYPDRHKVLVLVGSAKRPIPERSWYSTWHDATGGTVMTALPPGTFLDMFDDAITRQDPQHWLLAINAARWQHHPAEVLASIMAVAEITSSASRVFISYRRLETQSLAVQLFDALTHEGFETFLDRFSIPVGLDFQRRLTQELEDKSMVVLLESRFLKDSKWTQHEVDFVKQYRLGLATLRMPDVRESDRLPSATIGRQLDLQASDFVRAPQLVPKADDPNTSMFEWPELRRDALERVVGEIKRAHADALFQRRYRLRDDLRIALRKAGLEPDEVIRRGAAGRVRRAHREAVVALNEGDVVFLSASVPTRRPFVDDAEPAEIEEAIVSVARAVFSRSGRMLFGGHPSVSPLIASIAGAYVAPDPDRPVTNRPIVTFQSEHFKHQLPNETWELHSMGWSAIEWTPPIGTVAMTAWS